MRKKKNRYKLDMKADAASRKIVLEAVVQYDIESDEFKSLVAVRNDVENDDLLLRIGRQLEGAIRKVIRPYDLELELVEKLARIGKDIGAHDEGCDCAPVP